MSRVVLSGHSNPYPYPQRPDAALADPGLVPWLNYTIRGRMENRE
jgi:hypothetical protein